MNQEVSVDRLKSGTFKIRVDENICYLLSKKSFLKLYAKMSKIVEDSQELTLDLEMMEHEEGDDVT